MRERYMIVIIGPRTVMFEDMVTAHSLREAINIAQLRGKAKKLINDSIVMIGHSIITSEEFLRMRTLRGSQS